MINYFEHDKNGIILGYGVADKLPKGNYKEVHKNRLPTGANINHYNTDETKKPLSQLVSEKLVEVPEGSKLDGEDVAWLKAKETEKQVLRLCMIK